jgi:hypothetical protein
VAVVALSCTALSCGDDSGNTGTDLPLATTSTVSPAAGGGAVGQGGGGAPGDGAAGGKTPDASGSNSGDGSQNGPGGGNDK